MICYATHGMVMSTLGQLSSHANLREKLELVCGIGVMLVQIWSPKTVLLYNLE